MEGLGDGAREHVFTKQTKKRAGQVSRWSFYICQDLCPAHHTSRHAASMLFTLSTKGQAGVTRRLQYMELVGS
jgi:hypothetical protein